MPWKNTSRLAVNMTLESGFIILLLTGVSPDISFPGLYRGNAEEMKEQTYKQVKELLSNYGKIDIMWWDGGGDDWLAFGCEPREQS